MINIILITVWSVLQVFVLISVLPWVVIPFSVCTLGLLEIFTTVLKLVYLKISIQVVFYCVIVMFLSYLVRQLLKVSGVFNDFQKKPLHIFFEYVMLISLFSFFLWTVNNTFTITDQGYVWTATRILLMGFAVVCVRPYIVAYFKPCVKNIRSIFLMLAGSVSIIILFLTDGMAALFGLFVSTVYAAGDEVASGEGTQHVPHQVGVNSGSLVPMQAPRRDSVATVLSLYEARIDRSIRCTPTSDLLRFSGSRDFRTRHLREVYGKPLRRLHFVDTDFGEMERDLLGMQMSEDNVVDGRMVPPTFSVEHVQTLLHGRFSGKPAKSLALDELKALLKRSFESEVYTIARYSPEGQKQHATLFEKHAEAQRQRNERVEAPRRTPHLLISDEMFSQSEHMVREYYDKMLYVCPLFRDILYPSIVNYNVLTRPAEIRLDLDLLLEEVRFTHGNNEKLEELLKQTRLEHHEKFTLEKRLAEICLEFEKDLVLEKNQLEIQRYFLSNPLVLQDFMDQTGLAERDLLISLEARLKRAESQNKHNLALELSEILQEKHLECKQSEALNKLKVEKSLWNEKEGIQFCEPAIKRQRIDSSLVDSGEPAVERHGNGTASMILNFESKTLKTCEKIKFGRMEPRR